MRKLLSWMRGVSWIAVIAIVLASAGITLAILGYGEVALAVGATAITSAVLSLRD